MTLGIEKPDVPVLVNPRRAKRERRSGYPTTALRQALDLKTVVMDGNHYLKRKTAWTEWPYATKLNDEKFISLDRHIIRCDNKASACLHQT